MKLSMAEILLNIGKLPTHDQKVQAFKQNYSIPFGALLKMAFDPTLVWDLPKSDPPYKPSDQLDGENLLFTEAKKLYYFHVDGYPGLKQAKKQQMFVEVLEAVSPNDAIFLLAVRNKNLPEKFPGITKSIIDEAYPGLLVY